jgi:phosphoesterase RecJ-like protein
MKYFPEASQAFQNVIEGELKTHKIAVLGHRRPDGDCIGSQVALCRVLMQNGVDAVAVNHDSSTRVLESFIGDTPFFQFKDFQADGHEAVTTDCADLARVGPDLSVVFPHPLLNIDHHISNTYFAANNIVLDDTCATAEILAGIFFDLGLEVDAITAQALYIGIATDSGQYRYPADYPRLFELSKLLCECGATPAVAANRLYEQESFARIKLLQRFFDSMKLECDGKICIGFICGDDYEETGATPEDLEGVVDYARSIEGVEIGALIEDRNGIIKGSLRGKGTKYRLDLVASKFNGGGHAAAAGLNTEGDFINFRAELLKELKGSIDAASNNT